MEIDCDALSERVGCRVHAMVQKTHNDGRERGAYIYKQGDNLVIGKTHKGGRGSISMRAMGFIGRLLTNREIVGTVHTHPDIKYDTELSLVDMKMLADDMMEVAIVGYIEDGRSNMSVFESNKMGGDLKTFIRSLEGDTRLELVQNGTEKLRTCSVRLWPLS